MAPFPSRLPRRIAPLGHLGGFLGASYLIDWGFRGLGVIPAEGIVAAGHVNNSTAGRLPEGMLPALLEGLPEIVFSATLEELFYRGLVFEGIRRFKGLGWAIAGSTALFAIAHPNPPHAAAAGLLGLYLGFLRAGHGLTLPILAHAANNALGWAMPFLPCLGLAAAGSIWGGIVAGALLALIGISAATLRQEMRSRSSEKEVSETSPSAYA